LIRHIKGLPLAQTATSAAGPGNLDKIAGKVFLNDTRRHKKEKAPNWALFIFASARCDALAERLADAYARLRYSCVRVSISILSPMLQKSGTCSSKPVFSFAFFSTLPDDVSPLTAGSV
jgi:hypothetical protein